MPRGKIRGKWVVARRLFVLALSRRGEGEMTEVEGKTSAGSPGRGSMPVDFRGTPSECPSCHRKQVPMHLTDRLGRTGDDAVLMRLHQCTNPECEELFIARYRPQQESNVRYFVYERSTPARAEPIVFSDEIKEVSPSFVKIHGQALEAEAARLDELAGMGLRKALEFLIKDFAVQEADASAAEKIRRLSLSKCIEEYVDDANLKAVATRAAWLGNDETHYVRHWTDKDISDLKLLVRLAVNWVESVLLTEKYEREMPE